MDGDQASGDARVDPEPQQLSDQRKPFSLTCRLVLLLLFFLINNSNNNSNYSGGSLTGWRLMV